MHGYAIMRRVEELTDGAVTMGPGTLYGAVKRMLADGLIEETAERPDPALDDQRRRYYRVTALGERVPRRGGHAARDAAQERTSAERVMPATRMYRALIWLYPRRFRREYGDRDDPALHATSTRPRTARVPASVRRASRSRSPTSTGRRSWQPHP